MVIQRRFIFLCLLVSTGFYGEFVLAQAPYSRPDDTKISISGTVDEVEMDSFTLDYGQGTIRVEMSDSGRDAGAYDLGEGDKVTVTGRIDDDIYETAAIDASSVYIDKIGTYFTTGPAGNGNNAIDPRNDVDGSDTILQGTVTSVGEEEFTLDTGSRRLTVEVDEMAFNPLAEGGLRNVQEGDRVNVTGNMENEFFEDRVFDAQTVAVFENAE